jgi:hypothetical protein
MGSPMSERNVQDELFDSSLDVVFSKRALDDIYRNHLLVAASAAEREGFSETRAALIGLLTSAMASDE